MDKPTPQPRPTLEYEPRPVGVVQYLTKFFTSYFWLIFKNVIGWIFILAAFPVGVTVPGPGGFPLFIIGFAMVTFPGKRKLTSRVMRGRGLPLEADVFTFLTALVSIAITIALVWLTSHKYEQLLEWLHIKEANDQKSYTAMAAALLGVALAALCVTWIVARLALRVLNWALRAAPRLRRYIRPWMKSKGINLLPPRRMRRGPDASKRGEARPPDRDEEEILSFSEANQTKFRSYVRASLPWIRRGLGVLITVLIFHFILKPIREKWPLVRERVLEFSEIRFLCASLMFAIFLFTFRALAWWRILIGFGHRLPLPAAVRIWSSSELARYIPGAILQVAARVYLVKPYGVRGSVCSVTQILELTVFLLANVLIAVSALLYHGFKNVQDGWARFWLIFATAILPLLILLLHPKVFYGLINPVLDKFGKPRIVQRLRGKVLFGLLGWNVLGLLFQSIALFILMQPTFELKWDWWWVVAGAYCLAWCAGFLAFWAPGGLGMRELVLVGALQFILPEPVLRQQGLTALLAFIAIVIRLWATTGELILATIAYTLDYRGALGRPDAPGRIEATPDSPIEPVLPGMKVTVTTVRVTQTTVQITDQRT